MSSKIILLDDHFATGEPTVQLVSTWGRGGRLLKEATSLHKIASTSSPALDYIKNVAPEPGKTVVLVIGLGDHETYGANRNGDGFPSRPVKGKIDPDEVLTKHYQSYDKAHVFEHHVNNDPAKAIGRVKKAFWNPVMRRVELVEDFDNAKAAHLLEKIASGEYPAKSMGCVLFDTPITTMVGRVPAGLIEVGTPVLTHKGNWKKVFELHRRYYKGNLYSIRTATGVSQVTHEHPYAVMRSVDVLERRNGNDVRKKPKDIDLDKIQWMPAEALEESDYLLTPFNTDVKETLTVDECRLLGYYAADGFVVVSKSETSTLHVTHNVNNPARYELKALQERLDPSGYTNQREHANSSECIYTTVYSQKLADLCERHVGCLAHHKKLSVELCQQPLAQQLAFLGAYINGDGGNDKHGDFYISSCNENLMYQIQQIGFRCGMYSRISTIKHKPSTVVDKDTVEYRADFSRQYCNTIAPYTVKVQERVLKASSTGPIFVDNVILSKIKDIAVEPFEGPVFNFEVEDDNSYMADNHAVHNCRIKYDVCTNCGNKAKTRADYCDHLKYAMSRVDPNSGIQNAALNPSPDFFDSSWVIRPADRTGFMMKKVAKAHPYELKLGGYELAELVTDLQQKAADLGKAADIEKIMQGEPALSVSNLDKNDASLVEKYIKSKPAASKDKPTDTASVSIMINYKPSEVQGTADPFELPLGIKEIMQYFISKLAPEIKTGVPDKTLKAANDHLGLIYEIFNTYPRFYDTVVKEAGLDTPTFNPDLYTKLALSNTPGWDYLGRQMPGHETFHNERPKTDMMTWTDPNTGVQYSTNYGSAQRTNDALVSRGLKQKALTGGALLGTGALLGGAAYAGRHKPPSGLRKGMGLVGAGLGLVGGMKLLGPTPVGGPKVVTDQGETISGWTDMTPVQKTGSSINTTFAYVVKRASERPKKLDAVYTTRFMQTLKHAEVQDELSPYLGPTLDFDKVTQALGTSILRRSE